MSFEEEFDRKIRQKTDEASYQFDEANWAKASVMMDAERKVAKNGKLGKYYIPSAILGLSITVLTLVYLKPETKTVALVNAPVVVQPIATENSPAVSETSPVGAPVTAAAPETVKPAEAVALVTEKKENTVISEPARVNKTPVSSAAPAIAKAVPVQRTASSLKPAETTANKTNTAVFKTEAAFAIENNEPLATRSEKPAENAVPAENTKPAEANESTGFEAVKEAAATANNNTLVRTIPAQKETPVQQESPANTEAETVAKEEALTVEQLDLLGIYQPVEEADIIAMPFVLLPRYDDDYYKKLRTHKTHFVNAEAGADYNLGWETASGWDGRGFNWFGGFNYGYYLTRKIVIGAGLQAYNLQNTKEAFFTITKTDYHFGSTLSGTVITSKNLLYAAVPVRVYYSPNTYNQFGLGLNVAYLIDAQSTVQTYTDNSEHAKVYDPVSTTKGIYNGTNQTNLMLSAFYKVQFNRRFGVNAEFVYGFNDVFKNTATIKTAEKPMGFRLSLQYTLFDK